MADHTLAEVTPLPCRHPPIIAIAGGIVMFAMGKCWIRFSELEEGMNELQLKSWEYSLLMVTVSLVRRWSNKEVI